MNHVLFAVILPLCAVKYNMSTMPQTHTVQRVCRRELCSTATSITGSHLNMLRCTCTSWTTCWWHARGLRTNCSATQTWRALYCHTQTSYRH